MQDLEGDWNNSASITLRESCHIFHNISFVLPQRSELSHFTFHNSGHFLCFCPPILLVF